MGYGYSGAPILCDITINGRTVKAVAQPTKQSFLYVFNRETGEPIWPIEERPVPKGDVPGEWYSPTQPFPTKPPAYDNQGVSIDQLIDFTPELRAEAVKLVSKYRIGPLFTPPSVSKADGPLRHDHFAGLARRSELAGRILRSRNAQALRLFAERDRTTGAGSYAGAAIFRHGVRPGHGRSRAAAQHADGRAAPSGSARRSAAPRGGEGGATLTVSGLPLLKPPYGRITAYDMDKGEIAWQVAHGETPDVVRNNPALKGLTIPRTGQQGLVGVLTTKSLVIAGEPLFTTTANGRARRDAARLRQSHRQGSWRRVHARAAKRFADDVHAQRTAVHRRSGQRSGAPW